MSNDNDNITQFPKAVKAEAVTQEQGYEQTKLKTANYKVTVWKEDEDGSLSQFTYDLNGHLVITGTNVVVLDDTGDLSWACPNNDALISVERV